MVEIYNRAFETKLIQSDIDQLAPVVLARGGYERRRAEGESEGNLCNFPSEINFLRLFQDQDALPTLIGVVESGIEMARHGSALYLSWLT